MACDACVREIASVAERLERVEEDSLRYLPAVLDRYVRKPDRSAELVVVARAWRRLLITFRGLQSAAGEWEHGCRSTHVPAIKERAEEVATACRLFDDALRRME
jgi:hypothetical protein